MATLIPVRDVASGDVVAEMSQVECRTGSDCAEEALISLVFFGNDS